MTDFSLNLPDKRLKMKAVFAETPSNMIIGALFLLLLAAGIFWWANNLARSAYTDYQIQRGPHHIVPGADIDGECEAHAYILTICDTKIRTDSQTLDKHFAFFDLSFDDYSVYAIAPDNGSDQITLSLAADKAINRLIFALCVAGVGLVCISFAFYRAFIDRFRISALLRGLNRADAQPWQLTTIDAFVDDDKIKHYMVDIHGTERKIAFSFGKKMEPWLLDVSGDTARLLAFAPADGGAAVPFDRELKTIGGLKKSERQALIAELERMTGN
jgi:hypothetical protein